MSAYLCLTVRFLDPEPQFFGTLGDGKSEWPPSPLRFFQAIVCAAAHRWPGEEFGAMARPALEWLEKQQPLIVTPTRRPTPCGYRMYVPNNSGDLMTAAWYRGNTNATMAEHRVEKDVVPIRMNGDALHYLFPLEDEECPSFDVLRTVARSLTHLGWGISPVAGDATVLQAEELSSLAGESWRPTLNSEGGVTLRVSVSGTLNDLTARHEAFLGRFRTKNFQLVSPLSVYRVVSYRRSNELAQMEWAVFRLLDLDANQSKSFDAVRRAREVAGMLRHATAEVAARHGWPESKINTFVHGKTSDGSNPSSGKSAPDRFHYLPLPTINWKMQRVESIRRVLVAAPSNCTKEIAWIKRNLPGIELVSVDGPVALLTHLPIMEDWVARQYVQPSGAEGATTWSTVTPVILPGYDDPGHLRRKLELGCDAETQRRYLGKLDGRMNDLLRKAFQQAGVPLELLNGTEIQWRQSGFRSGVDLAKRYLPPENLQALPRYHVRVKFPSVVKGPLAVGSGRFRGFGLFARED